MGRRQRPPWCLDGYLLSPRGVLKVSCPMDVRRAADSAPSASRDFDAEISALLARAEEVRAQADAIDVASATEATLLRTVSLADDAIGRGDEAAQGTRDKIHEQQERFKAHVL